jgi:KaiC/GvpD/RAD55 family RecA-like ATPase
MYNIQSNVHSEEFYNAVSYMVDGIFDMRIEEDEELHRFFRIRSLKNTNHETKWIPFKIQNDRKMSIKLEGIIK